MEVNQEVSGMIDDLVRESLGSTLSSEREKNKLSIREVAESLKLMPYQIEALEKDDFSAFKADIFVKSYLKNYAELLKIDAKPLLVLFENEHAKAQTPPVVSRPKPIQVPCKKRYVGVIAAIFIVLVLWLLNQEEPDDGAALTDQSSQIVDVEHLTLSESANDSAYISPPENQPDIASLIENKANLDGSESSGELLDEPLSVEVIDEPDVAANEDIDVESIVSEAVDNNPEHSLELNFTAECWVEIKDAAGKMLMADLKRSGDKVQVEGIAPFEVLLGYAPAASISYNGEPVVVNVNTRSKSARVVVGKS